ncbi:MAG: hypothetical protein R6V06_00155 [Kiritimatiellia bacterium]
MISGWTVSAVDSFVGFLLRLTTGGVRYVSAFASAFLLSFFLTPLMRAFARKTGMVDQPDARRINKVAIPRGGGIAVFLAFHLSLLIFVLLGNGRISNHFTLHWHLNFFLASLLLLIIGFIDDKWGMKAFYKLIGQIVVAAWLFLVGVRIGGIVVAFPDWLDFLVTMLWIVGAINALNLIDGMDGLSAGLSFIACLGLAGALLFTGHTADTLPYLVLAGACLGFLRYNFHPASVFLGDSGSMFLGLCLATMPLVTGSQKELVASLGVPLLAMGVPIFDTILAIWRRTARALLPKELVDITGQTRIMQPDKEHLHHRILQKTSNQRTAAVVLYAVSMFLVLAGLVGMLLHNHAPAFFMIVFMVAVVVAVRHMMSVELWDTGRLFSRKRATLRQAIILPLYIGADIFVLLIAWITARFFSGLPLDRDVFLHHMPVIIGVMFVSLVLSKTYRRVWSRAQIRDFVVLASALAGSSLLASALMMFVEKPGYGTLKFALLLYMCAFFPVVGLRVLRECFYGVMHSLERMAIADEKDTRKILVFGGGTEFRLYLKKLISNAGNNKTLIVGLLDDDINLRNRIISGYKVMGGLEDLPECVKKTGADCLLITCDLDSDRKDAIKEMLNDIPVEIMLWKCSEEKLK